MLIYALERKNFHKWKTQSRYISQINSVATLNPALRASALFLRALEANAFKKRNLKTIYVSLINKDVMERMGGGSGE